MPGVRAYGQQCDMAWPEGVENCREPGGRAVGVNRNQVALGVRRELYCRTKMLRRADSRNDDRINNGLGDGSLTGWSIDSTNRNIRKLKQVLV